MIQRSSIWAAIANWGNLSMGAFLTFRKMITPLVIEVIFWILVVLCVILGVIAIASGQGVNGAITGLVLIFLGPLFVRMYCELTILMFRVYDVLIEIRDKGKMA
jgi:hypothetical protein